MEIILICAIILVAIAIFVWYHLHRTNGDWPDAEANLPYVIDWPETIETQIVYNVNPHKGEPLPRFSEGRRGGLLG